MYILVVGYRNGDVQYYGPFKTETRASEYALSLDTDKNPKWHVKPIIAPYNPG